MAALGGSSIRLKVVLPVLFLLGAYAHAHAEERRGHIVLGSWLNPEFAESARDRFARELDLAIEVVRVEVNGTLYHRVQSAVINESAARNIVNGRDAWFSPTLQQPAPAEVAKAEEPEPVSVRTETHPAAETTPKQPATQSPRIAATLTTPNGALEIPYIEVSEIKIDGHVDEALWQTLPVIDGMRVIDPDSMEVPEFATQTRLFFTHRGLYVSAVMEQPQETLVSRLSSRDQFLNRDAFGITIDASGEGLYGYWFKVNLGGSLADGRVLPERTITEQWDGPWRGESQRTDTGWSTEMFLPWSMMALPENTDDRQVGIWLERKVAFKDELYGMPALPFTEPRFMSALQPTLLPDLEAQSQLAIFPYVSATHDAITDEDDYEVGADIAWRPNPNTQVTATLNPDFGAVESDDVVVNLTAFETFFPEKRLFFLEGTEVFVTTPRSDTKRFRSSRVGGGARPTPSTFTPEPTTLLNTRRIGGPPRQLTVPDGVEVDPVERGKPTDLLGAVKTTGSLGNVRYGVLAPSKTTLSCRVELRPRVSGLRSLKMDATSASCVRSMMRPGKRVGASVTWAP